MTTSNWSIGLRRFRGGSRPGTWPQRITADHCLIFLRKRKQERAVDVDDPAVATVEPMHFDPTVEAEPAAHDRRPKRLSARRPACGPDDEHERS
jgi:DNA-directed RNA polymerase specialized sigma24 family protein